MTTRNFAEGGSAVVGLARALTEATSLDQLGRAARSRFGRLMSVDMFGFYALSEDRSQIEHNVAVNVSDMFVDRYIRAMELDPLLLHTGKTGRAVANTGLMSEAEWTETAVYRQAYSLHSMRYVVEVPIRDGDEVLGALHFSSKEPDRAFTTNDVVLGEAAAGVLAISIKRIRRQTEDHRALERAMGALDLTGAALVVTDRRAVELQLNPAARSLLAQVVNGEEHLPPLLVPPPDGGRFSRHEEVMLRTGEMAWLHAHSQPVGEGSLATVLELQQEHALIDHTQLVSLTPRESEVALLMVEGLTDREIADQLFLSPFTVHQYVKRIYRALGVDSRVALTRLLLRAPVGSRRT